MQMVFLGNRVARWVISIGIFVLGFIIIINVWSFVKNGKISAEEITEKALVNLEESYSYRYKLTAVSVIEGKETLLTDIEGIWNKPDRFHIKGEALSTPIEAFILGEKYLVKDPTGGWMEFQSSPSLLQETIFFSETPLTDLQNLYALELVGNENYRGNRTYHLHAQLSKVTNPLWQTFWKDFYCELWITKQNYKLQRLELYGKTPGTEDYLFVELELLDYDSNLNITPPEEAEIVRE